MTAREAYVEALALQATIWGYPLLESVRTCRLATVAGDSAAAPEPAIGGLTATRPPINRFAYSDAPADADSRDVVTPANDLLYAIAWLNLAEGPVLLHVPPPTGRYFVMALYDAYTENFRNLGIGDVIGSPVTFSLAGPRWQGPTPAGTVAVAAPTDLVWIIGRVLVDDATDLAAARAFQRGFRLEPLRATPVPRPVSVERWRDAVPNEAPGPVFFENLARALHECPPAEADRALLGWYATFGLAPGLPFDAGTLSPEIAAAIDRGYRAGMGYIDSMTRSARSRPWTLSFRLGRWGVDYLARAVTAMKGLGALAADEALYATADFDSERRPLDGANRYRLRFEAGEAPPCDGFWSVTLYAEDFFLARNPIARHSIGDRTRGLRRDADGALAIDIGHVPPADPSNWLPAPAGRFYLILRMYRPRPAARGWQIPALECLRRVGQPEPATTAADSAASNAARSVPP